MVVRAAATSARLSKTALNMLYQRQVNVLGLILNCIDAEMPDYYYYRYPKYLRGVVGRASRAADSSRSETVVVTIAIKSDVAARL